MNKIVRLVLAAVSANGITCNVDVHLFGQIWYKKNKNVEENLLSERLEYATSSLCLFLSEI